MLTLSITPLNLKKSLVYIRQAYYRFGFGVSASVTALCSKAFVFRGRATAAGVAR